MAGSATLDAAAGRATGDRRLDLDWVRIGAFGLLIVYHVGMFYVSWPFHVKSPRPQTWLEPVMMLTHPWRLPLLFLVSGAATRFMADRMTAGRLAGLRTWRLLPPLLFAMFVVVPPQTWLQVAETYHAAPMPYARFWALYATASGHWRWSGAPLLTPTWNHLWFVVYLLIYTLGLCAALKLAPGAVRALQAAGERLLRGWGVIAWPAAAFVASRWLLAPRFPETHAVIGDWTLHAESLAPFLFGFLFGKSEAVWSVFVRRRRTLAVLAALSFAVVAWIVALPDDFVAPFDLRPPIRTAWGINQWTAIGAILGFARVHLATRDGPARRYLTEAIFPFYIAHQTIIVCVAWWLAKRNLPLGLEASLVILATVAGCFATYEVARRVLPLRPLLGLRLRPRRRPSPHRDAGPLPGVGLSAARERLVEVA